MPGPPRLVTPPAPPAPTNNGPLPEHRQKQVEAGLATFQSVIAERDLLEQKVRELTLTNDGLKVQLDSLQGVINMMESAYLSSKLDLEQLVRSNREERDAAVTRAAELDTVLRNVHVLTQTAIYGSTPDEIAPPPQVA